MRPLSLLAAAFLSIAACAGVLAACSDDNSTPQSDDRDSGDPGPGNNPGDSDSAAPDSGEQNACNDIPQEGQSIDVIAAPPPSPAGAGGTLADGKYVLTSVRAFVGFPEGTKLGTFGAYTLVVAGNTFKQVVTKSDGIVTHADGSLAITGVNFDATSTCEFPKPDGSATRLVGSYTVEGDGKVKMFVVQQGINAELTFVAK